MMPQAKAPRARQAANGHDLRRMAGSYASRCPVVKRQRGEADDARLVDVPLLVAAHLGAPRAPPPAGTCRAARLRTTGARRRSSCTSAQNPAASPSWIRSRRARSFSATSSIRPSPARAGEGVAVAPPDVRHVHAQHPEQAAALPGRDLLERAEEARHAGVVFGEAALVRAARVRPAEDGQDADARAEQVLQEHDLELDRVLDRMAVVLQPHGARRPARRARPAGGRRIPPARTA